MWEKLHSLLSRDTLEFGVVDDEILDQLLKPNIPRNEGFNNL